MVETHGLEVSGPLDLDSTLLRGQAFRWRREAEGWYSGVVRGYLLYLRKTPDGIEFRSNQPQATISPLLENYFRLDDDLQEIHKDIGRDDKIARLVSRYPGLRLLRQEPWECLVCYLCSANNNIGQIGRIADRLADAFGSPMDFDGQVRMTFPTPAQFVAGGLQKLLDLKLGLNRAENIFQASVEVVEGHLNLEELRGKDVNEGRERLLKCRGVGNKVANCVLLFSLDKLDAFPIDRHIGKALVRYCFPDLRETQLRTLQSRSLEHFGKYAGYAGQFLFHDMRQKSGASIQ